MYNCVSISSFQVEESFLVILIIIISIPHFMFLALGDSRPKQRCFAVLSNWRKFSISLSNTTLDIKAKAAGLSVHLWISHLLLMHGIFALGLPTWWPMPHWSNSLGWTWCQTNYQPNHIFMSCAPISQMSESFKLEVDNAFIFLRRNLVMQNNALISYICLMGLYV